MNLDFLVKRFGDKGFITNIDNKEIFQVPGKNDALIVEIVDDKYQVTVTTTNSKNKVQFFTIPLSVVGSILIFLKENER